MRVKTIIINDAEKIVTKQDYKRDLHGHGEESAFTKIKI